MVNRFDTYERPQFISTYVPLPLQYLDTVAKGMQDNYDKGLQATDSFSKIANAIKASPVGEGIKQNLISSFNKEKEDLYNSTQSYSDPAFLKRANDLVSKYANDPRIPYLAAEKELFDLQQKESTDPKNARNLNFTYNRFKDPSGRWLQANSIEELPLNAKITQFEDYNKAAKDVVGKIADSGYNKDEDFDFSNYKIANNGETQVYSRKLHGYVGVTDKKVQGLANLMTEEYGNTNAGKHHLQSLLQPILGDSVYNLDYQGLKNAALSGDPEAVKYKQAIDQEFKQHLFNANANQIGGITTSKLDHMQMTDRKIQGENDAFNFGKIITTNEQGNPESTDLNSVLEGLGINNIINSNGELVISGGLSGAREEAKIDGRTVSGFNFNFDNRNAQDIVNKAYSELAKKSKELGLGIPKDGNYKDQLYNYALTIAKQRSTTSNLQPNTSNALTQYFLGKNSNIHNMEVYPQGDQSEKAKVTNEDVSLMAGNSKITGIDYYGDNQAGWKIVVTPKDDKGNPTDVDKALIGIPRDKLFEEETRPIWTISKGALDFSKSGKVSEQYKDSNYNNVQEYSNKFIAGKPKITGSSTEYNDKGQPIIRGSFIQVLDGKPQLFGIEFNPDYVTPIIKSLDEIQNDKTTELQIKGSLNQYINKLGENTKPSKVR